MKKKKYYTIFVTEESDYHCYRTVTNYEFEESKYYLDGQGIFDLFLKERMAGNPDYTDPRITNENKSYVVEGIVTSDTPIEYVHLDEYECGSGRLVYDPSNRLGEE